MSPATYSRRWVVLVMVCPTGERLRSVVELPDWVAAMHFVHLAKSLTCCVFAEALDTPPPAEHGDAASGR